MSWNVICDRCGFKYKGYQLKKEWTGLMVCSGPGTSDCWEPRHPQDFVRAHPETNRLPYRRPEAADVEVANNFDVSLRGCSPLGEYCYAGIAEADCAIVGKRYSLLETS